MNKMQRQMKSEGKWENNYVKEIGQRVNFFNSEEGFIDQQGK